MAGIVGWDHGSLAHALDQGPALQGLLVVVVTAVAVEPVEHGDVALGPVDAVVPLGDRGVAALGRARGTGLTAPRSINLCGCATAESVRLSVSRNPPHRWLSAHRSRKA